MADSSITDWISAIAAASGVPLIIVGFIKVFKKNKSLEKRLSLLESLSISQENISKQMS